MPDKTDRLLGAPASEIPQGIEGREVSLNIPERIMFGLPGSNFELTKANPTGTIPYGLTQVQRNQLMQAIQRGHLIFGRSPVTERAKISKVVEPYFTVLRTPSIPAETVKAMINGIVTIPDGDPRLGNHSKREVLERLVEEEMKGATRAPVLEHLAAALEYIPGTGRPRDEPAPLVKSKPAGGSGGTGKFSIEPSKADIAGL